MPLYISETGLEDPPGRTDVASRNPFSAIQDDDSELTYSAPSTHTRRRRRRTARNSTGVSICEWSSDEEKEKEQEERKKQSKAKQQAGQELMFRGLSLQHPKTTPTVTPPLPGYVPPHLRSVQNGGLSIQSQRGRRVSHQPDYPRLPAAATRETIHIPTFPATNKIDSPFAFFRNPIGYETRYWGGGLCRPLYSNSYRPLSTYRPKTPEMNKQLGEGEEPSITTKYYGKRECDRIARFNRLIKEEEQELVRLFDVAHPSDFEVEMDESGQYPTREWMHTVFPEIPLLHRTEMSEDVECVTAHDLHVLHCRLSDGLYSFTNSRYNAALKWMGTRCDSCGVGSRGVELHNVHSLLSHLTSNKHVDMLFSADGCVPRDSRLLGGDSARRSSEGAVRRRRSREDGIGLFPQSQNHIRYVHISY